MPLHEPRERGRVQVHEIMNSPVITAKVDESIEEIASKMANFKVGSVIVMQKDTPIGIVTDGDIVLKVAAKNLRPSEVKAKSVMSKPVLTIDGEKDVTDAARQLRKNRIKRLGVTYRGKLVGIISVSDLTNITPEMIELIYHREQVMSLAESRRGKVSSGECDVCGQWSDYLVQTEGKVLCEECQMEDGTKSP